MSYKKSMRCEEHKDIKPISLEEQKSSRSYKFNQEQIENEIGKGDINWFTEASLRARNENSYSTVTPISQKTNSDLFAEFSSVDKVHNLLESQASILSPATAWLPPSLGKSPISNTAQQFDSQFDLVKSLGLNDSTHSWTSSLATPRTGISPAKEKTPGMGYKKNLSRMLFTPGQNGGADVLYLNKSEKCKNFVRTGQTTDITSANLQSNSQTPYEEEKSFTQNASSQNVPDQKQDVNKNLFGTSVTDSENILLTGVQKIENVLDIKVEPLEPLAEALSDFFDPPSKAAGRRRSAPSFGRTSATRKNVSISKLSKSFSQEDFCRDSMEPEIIFKCEENTPKKQNEVKILGNGDKICVKQEFINLQESRDSQGETIESPNRVEIVEVNTANDVEDEVLSQKDIFCSTPIVPKRPVKSILSSSKKTPGSSKRVRFRKDIADKIEIENVGTETCAQLSEKNNSDKNFNLGEESSEKKLCTYEVSSFALTPDRIGSNSNKQDGKETVKEINDDLFSQVSPTVLQEMCSMVSAKSVVSSQEKSNTINDNNFVNSTTELANSKPEVLGDTMDENVCKTVKETVSDIIKPVEKDQNIDSLTKIGNASVKNANKKKRFFYPTNSQINTSCPKTVYGFKHEIVEKEKVVSESKEIKAMTSAETVSTKRDSLGSPLVLQEDTPTKKMSMRTPNSSTQTGFKRYSEIVNQSDSPYSSKKRTLNEGTPSESSPVTTTLSRQEHTPVSGRRESIGIKRRRLCLKEELALQQTDTNDEKMKESGKKVLPNYVDNRLQEKLDSFQKKNKMNFVNPDSTGGLREEVTIPSKTVECRKDSLSNDVDVFGDSSFDELQDDLFAKDISSDVTLEKFSKTATANNNSAKERVPALSNNMNREQKQSFGDTKKDNVHGDTGQNRVFQGFCTAGGTKIGIAKAKVEKAEKILESVVNDCSFEFSDDMETSCYPQMTEQEGCLKDVNKRITVKANSCLDQNIEIKSLERESKINGRHAMQNECDNTEMKMTGQKKSIGQLDTSSVMVPEKSAIPSGVGFATASGKGIECSANSLTKAQRLLIESEKEAVTSCDRSLEFKSHDTCSFPTQSKPSAIASKIVSEPGNTFSPISARFPTYADINVNNATSELSNIVKFAKEYEGQEKIYTDDNNTSVDSGFLTASSKTSPILSRSLNSSKLSKDDSLNIENELFSSIDVSARSNFDCSGGFSTASGKDITLSASSLTKAKGLIQDVILSEKNDSKEDNADEKSFDLNITNTSTISSDCTGFSTASGKDLKLSTSSLSKAQKLINSIDKFDANSEAKDSNLVKNGFKSASSKDLAPSSVVQCFKDETLNSSCKIEGTTAKSKRDQFENIFNDMINQNVTLDQSEVDVSLQNHTICKDSELDLEKELENMLKPKVNNVKSTRPTKTSRFPAGANIPKGFRPFKPPKIIKKPEAKEKEKQDTSTMSKSCTVLKNERKPYERKQNKPEKEKEPEGRGNVGDVQFDQYLEDAFSDDMLPSQKLEAKFQKTSSLPTIHSTFNENCIKQSENFIKQNNKMASKSSLIGIEGDNKVWSKTDKNQCEWIDFRGDNSSVELEQIMGPENEFTQVKFDDGKTDNNSTVTFGINEFEKIDMKNPFQSASGKNISISEKALVHARKTLIDDTNVESEISLVDFECETITINTIPFQSASGKNVSVSEKALGKSKTSSLCSTGANGQNVSVSEKAQHQARKTSDENVNQFQSASGKNVTVSEKALEQARKTLSDENVNPFQSASGKNVIVSEKALQQARKTLSDENVNPFQSASGKNVIVSKKALQQARKPLSDENVNPFQNASGKNVIVSEMALEEARKTLSDENVNPFQSASGKKVIVSEKALEQARKTLSEENVDSFQSAADKNVIVSEKALKQARKTLDDKNVNPFQSASGKNVIVSEKALQQTRKTISEESVNPFQSASGKNVIVSEKVLQQARKTLSDENVNPFQSASGKNVIVSEKALQQARKTLSDENVNSFQSASGKSVIVSEKALEHGRKTLSDENVNPFQSASGKNVIVSEKALQQARKTLSDENVNPFQSASGKNVIVSEKALEQARKTLNDENVNLFPSASGKNMTVSEKALEHSRNSLCDKNTFGSEVSDSGTDLNHAKKASNENNPFQSASGRDILVSEKALQHARKTLNEKNDSANVPASPFSVNSYETELQRLNDANRNLNQTEEKKGHIQFKANTSPKLNKISKERIQVYDGISESAKRKRIDFDDDFDIPFDLLEQMEMHGKRLKIEDVGGKKPLTAVPEDYNRDRQIPGFSPKPMKSQSAPTKQSKRQLDYQITGDQIVPPKSSFKTPYKPSSCTSTESPKPLENKVKVATPVFVPKATSGKENFTLNQIAQSSHSKVTTLPKHQAKDQNVDRPQVVCNSKEKPSGVGHSNIRPDVVQLIHKSRKEQQEKIQQKTSRKVVPVEGRLYEMKQTQRRFRLKDVISLCRNKQKGNSSHMNPSTRQVRCCNAALHRFYLPDFYGSNIHHVIVGDGALLVPDDSGYAGKEELYQAFLTIEGVHPKLMDDKWFYNHYRWVVWKLASYEVNSPEQFAGRSLTPEVVMLQMKYRYDREIDKCQRSSIMKICERDDAPCKRMVLCVSNIQYDNNNTELKVSLTDGWYSINAKVDGPLSSLIKKGQIQIGHKLCTSGAELIGSENACPPLEAPESLMLKINANSTRPVSWDCRLGYQKDHTPLCVPLSSLYGEGGLVGCVDVVVVRKYPTMYMEKLPAGGCVFRSYSAEEKYKQSFQQIQQEKMEKLFQQMEKQFEKSNKDERCLKRKKWSQKEVEILNTGLEIYEAINSATHPEDVQTFLSDYQLELLMDHQRTIQEEKRQKLNGEFRKAWSEGEENIKDRIVVPLMKIRIVGCCRKDMDNDLSSLLTIWRPTSGHTDLVEGNRYKIYSLTAASSKIKSSHGGVQLTATKQTYFKPLALDDNILDLIYEPREVLTKQDLIQKRPAYREVDLVGIIISIDTMDNSGRQHEIIYMADINDDLIGVKFWGGLKHNGMADSLQEGVICCCSNLCDRSNYPSTSLPIAEFSTELSVLSQSPQYSAQRKHLEKIKLKLKNKSEYLNAVKERLNDKLERRNSLTANKQSPEALSNTDMSDTSTQTPNPKSASKMAALMSYQSPSPLSPIVLSSSKSIHKAFKPPSLVRK